MTDPPPASAPDLTGAVVYVEADSKPIAQGRWYVLPNDTVYFERDTGEITKSLIAASTLRNSPTWITTSG